MYKIAPVCFVLLCFTATQCNSKPVFSLIQNEDNNILKVMAGIRDAQLHCDNDEYYDLTVLRCMSCSDMCNDSTQRSCRVFCPVVYASKFIFHAEEKEESDVVATKQQPNEMEITENEKRVKDQIKTLRYAVWVCLISIIVLFLVCITIITFTEFKNPACCTSDKIKCSANHTKVKTCHKKRAKYVKSDKENLIPCA